MFKIGTHFTPYSADTLPFNLRLLIKSTVSFYIRIRRLSPGKYCMCMLGAILKKNSMYRYNWTQDQLVRNRYFVVAGKKIDSAKSVRPILGMNFKFEYLREIDFIIETKLEHESRDQMVFFYQQSKISRKCTCKYGSVQRKICRVGKIP
jgi:hypothetical protein